MNIKLAVHSTYRGKKSANRAYLQWPLFVVWQCAKEMIKQAEKIIIATGIVTALVLIAYFFLMKFLKLNYVLEGHYLNIMFIFLGIIYATRRIRKKLGDEDYLHVFIAGIAVAFIASLLFNVFLGVWLDFIDTQFMNHIIKNAPLGNFMTPWRIAFVLFVEETTAGVILSLIASQFRKRSGLTELKA